MAYASEPVLLNRDTALTDDRWVTVRVPMWYALMLRIHSTAYVHIIVSSTRFTANPPIGVRRTTVRHAPACM